MILEKGVLSFIINGVDKGVCFKEDRLATSNDLVAFIKVSSGSGGQIDLLEGSCQEL